MDEFLEHFGVTGMKWGVRKDRRSADAKEARTLGKRKISTLSNAELTKLNNRMQLEQNYKRLKIGNKPTVQKWVESQINQTASKFVQSVLTGVVKAAIKTVMNRKTANPSDDIIDALLLED